MENEVSRLVQRFESGQIDRRQLIAGLGSLVALVSMGQTAQAQEPESTFEATELNHIALRVTDVLRSREFYRRHLGMTWLPESDPRGVLTAPFRALRTHPNVLLPERATGGAAPP